MFVQSFKGSALSPPIGYFSTIETSPTVKVTAVFNTKLIFVYKFLKNGNTNISFVVYLCVEGGRGRPRIADLIDFLMVGGNRFG